MNDMTAAQFKQFMLDCESQDTHDTLLFQAQCAELEAGVLDDCMPRPADNSRRRFSRRTPTWAASLLAQQQERRWRAAVLALRAAQGALKSGLRDKVLARARAVAPRSTRSTQRGAQTRSEAKSGDSNSADGDPDPADRIIADPFASINAHVLTRPINRISRKAILAHRQGLEQKNPHVYNWYVSRALREIERAMVSVLGKKATLSQDSLDEIPIAASRLFTDLAGTHRFEDTPNPVFTHIVAANCFKTTFKLHDYVAPDNRNPGAREARKEALALGIARGSSRADAADVYALANGLVEGNGACPRLYTLPEDNAIPPSAFEIDGVPIQHIPAAPVQVSAGSKVQMRSLDRDDDDTGGGDALELDALDAVAFDPAGHDEKTVATRRDYAVLNADDFGQYILPGTEDFDTCAHDEVAAPETYTDSINHPGNEWGSIDDTPASLKAHRAAENALHVKAGTIARQLINHVDRAPDRTAAAREVTSALNQQDGALRDRVLKCISQDRSTPSICANILQSARWADAEALFRAPAKPDLDHELVRLGRMSDITISDCRTQYIDKLYETVGGVGGFHHRNNLRSALKTRALNKLGKSPPEVVRVARLLIDCGYPA